MNAYFLSMKPEVPKRGYWDMGFIESFLSGSLWQPPDFPEFKIQEVAKLPKGGKALVVLPARHHADYVYEVNKELKKIDHIVLFLMGDEEAAFKVEDINHPSIHIWIQNPHPGRHDQYNKLGTTYPPQSQEILPTLNPAKEIDVFFAGQVTHSRRTYLKQVLDNYRNDNVVTKYSKGFTEGIPHEEYYSYMVKAKIAPCPSGAVIPDSFRLFEALESMAIPIADEVTPDGTIYEYWDWLFGEICPFPRVVEWDRLPPLAEELLEDWPRNMHQITAWWVKYKRNFVYKVLRQLCEK